MSALQSRAGDRAARPAPAPARRSPSGAAPHSGPAPARRTPSGAAPPPGPLHSAGPAFPLQRRSAGESEPGVPPAEEIGQRIRARAGHGAPLGEAVRSRLEAGLGADLSAVRIHTDAEADRLSRSVQAVAFTSGADIYFRSGAYNPGSSDGLRLLAHEATHTLQQAAGPVAGTPAPGGVSISDPGDAFERAAEATAARVAAAPVPTPAQRQAPV